MCLKCKITFQIQEDIEIQNYLGVPPFPWFAQHIHVVSKTAVCRRHCQHQGGL